MMKQFALVALFAASAMAHNKTYLQEIDIDNIPYQDTEHDLHFTSEAYTSWEEVEEGEVSLEFSQTVELHNWSFSYGQKVSTFTCYLKASEDEYSCMNSIYKPKW